MKYLVLDLLAVYKAMVSPFLPPACRFEPTCSEYTRDAIWQFGFWPGGWMGLARFWRCRPGGTHGYDPVPEKAPERARWYAPWRYGRWRGPTHEHHH